MDFADFEFAVKVKEETSEGVPSAGSKDPLEALKEDFQRMAEEFVWMRRDIARLTIRVEELEKNQEEKPASFPSLKP